MDNEKEKNMLREWAEKNNFVYQFSKIEKEKESYFIQCQESSYIREYGFETLSELFQELDCMWQGEKCMEQIKKAVGVATLKNKPSEEIPKQVEKSHTDEAREVLPEFIYNF
ncbi:MAG: hypothetical protein NC489_15155 [Ruminococcus flavefaciens]|nr:hypothetical protein [Roseburia sp.]MCM1231456.1 hypothetical protein [Ruminococcus flavefaciens]